jgi:hypothetical protein
MRLSVRLGVGALLSTIVGCTSVAPVVPTTLRPSDLATPTTSTPALASPTPTPSFASSVPATPTPSPRVAHSPSPSPDTPRAGFDPAAPLFAFLMPDQPVGIGGVWITQVDGSHMQHWTAGDRTFLEAPLPDGIIWREIQPNTSKGAIYVGQTGSPARLLTKRAWGSLPTSDTTSDAFYISLVTPDGDDGVWRFPLEGSASARVLPALPGTFERGLQPMSLAVSDDGRKIARTFAAGDIDMGGSDWVAQILDGQRYWEDASIGRVLDFTADDQLVISMTRGYGIYDLQTRKRHLDSRDWFEFPTASPDGRFVATLTPGHVTLLDRTEGTSLEVSLPSFHFVDYWLTKDALVLEGRSVNWTGVGHHLVMDLRTGWYRVFDTVDSPISNP